MWGDKATMDFMNRITPNQPQAARPSAPPESVELARGGHDRGERRHNIKGDWLSMSMRISTNLLLVVVALLVAAVVWYIYAATPASQAKYVDSTKLQAVFLNTGQVYFGDIQALNKDYLVVTNVYYLQSSNTSGSSSASSANQNISLVKLGCELHMPYDRMVVNTNQVTFWENLQSDGQVAKAVSTFQKQNPSGQKCSNQGSSSNSSSNLQNSSNATTNKQ